MLARWLLGAACVASAGVHAQTDQPLLAAVEHNRPAYLRDLAQLVNLDSGTDDGAGLARVRQVLVDKLQALGADVRTVAAPPAVGQMVVGTWHGTGTRNLLLMIHYDTVFGVGEAARRPFKIDGHKAYGPGVADAKGGALMILYALDIARARGFRDYRTLTVLFNPDEEKSSLGSRTLIQQLSAQQDAVLIYEPPDAERVIVATNGIAYVHLDVTGLASHAGSAPEKGHNAAIELAHQLLQLNQLGDPAKGTTVNWTLLQAGSKPNIIPDHASATADMRMADVAELERVQRDASRLAASTLVPGTTATVQVENRRPPFSRNPASDQLAALANTIYGELGKSIAPVAMRYGTDAGFAYHAGSAKPAVLDGLGIVGDRLHSPDEWADLDSITPRLYLTVRLLETLGKTHN